MRDRYINKNHPISDYSLVRTVMLHHAVSYEPTLWHVYLERKVNDEIFYHHFVTGNNTYTLHCYQGRKSREERNDHKVKK